jgi:aspartate--ammonia ligase
MADKKADMAGPGIGNYDDLMQELPDDYESLLSPKETMQAVFAIK